MRIGACIGRPFTSFWATLLSIGASEGSPAVGTEPASSVRLKTPHVLAYVEMESHREHYPHLSHS